MLGTSKAPKKRSRSCFPVWIFCSQDVIYKEERLVSEAYSSSTSTSYLLCDMCLPLLRVSQPPLPESIRLGRNFTVCGAWHFIIHFYLKSV